ncbi:MAG: COX15/CtaA family protein [Chloroflexota bacterium]
MSQLSNFAKYAWFNVGYTVLVILGGALVRATGSGAGCGRSWPACNGEVIPRAESTEVLIEFSHRVTSGITGLFIIGLVVWAYRRRPIEANPRLLMIGAWLSLIFVIIEGGIGAALVRMELVEDNASVLRAIAIGGHLVNTYILLMWLVITAWAASVPKVVLRMSRVTWMLVGSLVLMAILSAAGAVTALGDTLFLSGALTEQFGAQGAAEHFLVQLRVIHPVMAVFVSIFLVGVSYTLMGENSPRKLRWLAFGVMGLVGAQTLMGLTVIILRAPLVTQISHLLLADALWIVLLLLTFEAAAYVREVPEPSLQRAEA